MKVQAGNDIAERCLSICDVLGNMRKPFIYEMPAPLPESASQLTPPGMQRLLYERHAWVCTMDQCLAGSIHTKPTAFVTNIASATEPWPSGLCGKCNHDKQVFKYVDGEIIRRFAHLFYCCYHGWGRDMTIASPARSLQKLLLLGFLYFTILMPLLTFVVRLVYTTNFYT